MTTQFEERSRAARARIDPFDPDDQDATRILRVQSGERWLRTDEHATAPTWSRIQLAVAITEPETAKVLASRAVEEQQTRVRVCLEKKRSDLRIAAWMGAALVALALWLWLLALLPIVWAR